MKEFNLKANPRTDLGKKASKALRVSNEIPAVLYGEGEVQHLVITQEAVRKLVYSPEIFLINLDVNGQSCKCIMKDIQFHPVNDRILHMDLLRVSENKPVVMEVPVVLKGHSVGVKAGGKLQLDMRRLRVKAVYSSIPENLVIDVTKLGLGKTIQVGELAFEGLELMNAKNAVVCAVKLTRAAQGAARAAMMEATDEEEEATEE
ncbi:50S ribosomal protein L25/general stress protein Ctc [Porphyromonas crevioricanis]|uniref:Large ribosomal subunit protein bL25 n=2 Tax=Porphyromonas crevioricanis TaxID=393921 RepID=A0A2X4SQZ0_9PORP|nr:50S ribosomal protein L25/general stress protein Ctc [Porphyromonas crevioricanis]GAD04444.1 LSU ribosomal protein L25p [Porphyromonas crevioricanis JCM 15906]GAD07029.1 LSU ribosomal protein L25p [Porphyromonas crevioricanis JCM 13913]SJZ76225.1 large subunit ribosomal protein L25 [Porphyromonas crevioricanis]SQH72311.1 General stress protein CTC [Porphyromonas crevioricanis]